MEYVSEQQAAMREAARADNPTAGMSQSDRADLARSLADYSTNSPQPGSSRRDQPPTRTGSGSSSTRGVIKAEDAEAARVAADLQRTERRLETRVTGSTVGVGSRLVSRAGRLERKLRRLS
jgi:hypothetical protein